MLPNTISITIDDLYRKLPAASKPRYASDTPEQRQDHRHFSDPKVLLQYLTGVGSRLRGEEG